VSKIRKPKLNLPIYKIIAVAAIVLLGLWLYKIHQSKKSPIYHMENFLNKQEEFNSSGNQCENSNKPYKLLFFYMTSCPHCVDFKPIWNDFVEESKQEKYMSKLCITDISAENETTLSKYGVSSFPTVLFIKPDGSSVAFENNRTTEELKKFVYRNIVS
jgi:thiol-disulfide isomerase/thioredoxin